MPEDPNLEKLNLEIGGLREKGPLELAKLRLEIDSLRTAFRRTLITSLLTAIVTVSIAVGGWLLEQSRARDAARRADANHRDEVFAKVMDNFGSPNPSMRMAATVALTRFAKPSDDTRDQVVAALLNRLSVEDDVSAVDQIVLALKEIGRPALAECVVSNQRAVVEFARASGRYRVLVGGPDEAAFLQKLSRVLSLVESSDEYRLPVRRFVLSPSALFVEGVFAAPFKREKGAWKELGSQPSADPAQITAARNAVIQKWRYVRATSAVIVGILRSGSGSWRKTDVSGIVITDGDLRGLDLRGIVLRSGLIMSRNLEGSDLSCADLSFTNLRTSFLDNTKFRGAKLRSTIFPDPDTGWFKVTPDMTGANWSEARWTVYPGAIGGEGLFKIEEKPLPGLVDDFAKRQAEEPFSQKECPEH